MQPVTPPRSRRGNNHNNSSTTQTRGLFTPKTPFGKKLDKAQQSPELLNKQAATLSIISPGPTPRHRYSSKKLGDAFVLSSTSNTARSLFPPTPSTVGSGRKKNSYGNFLVPSQHSPIKHSGSQLEESPVPLPTKRKLLFEESEEEDFEEEGFTIPSTPTKNLISDDLIREWNQEDYPEDNDLQVHIKKSTLVNPFITSVPQSSSQTNLKLHRNKNHNPNELILVNKKGEKIIKQLDSDYKPKNLFGDLQLAASSSKPKPFLVFNDNDDK